MGMAGSAYIPQVPRGGMSPAATRRPSFIRKLKVAHAFACEQKRD